MRIIKQIIFVFFKIFIPILYVLFLIAGLICAVVSGLIEFKVFSGLYPQDISTTLYFSIPFLIVFAFEVSKVFLIFLHKHHSFHANSRYEENQGVAYIKTFDVYNRRTIQGY